MLKILASIVFSFVISWHGMSQPPIKAKGERVSEEEIGIEDLYIAANQKKILNKYEEAIDIYNKILEHNEVNPAVHHDMARIYLSMEEKEKAISSAKKAVRYDQSNYWYLMTLAMIYEETLQHFDAANTLLRIIGMKPDEVLYNRVAQNLVLADKKNEAIEIYNNADEIYGWDEYRSDSKVELFLELKKEKEAVNEVKKWSEKFPDNIEYLVKLARFYEFRGESNKSRKIFMKVLALDPDNEEALVKTKKIKSSDQSGSEIAVLIKDSRIGIDNKIKSIIPLLDITDRHEEIKMLCESIIDQYPENAKSYALYGDAFWISGDAINAVVQYERSLTLNKSVYQVWDQLMMALAATGQYERLKSLSSDALDYYPNQAGPYYYNAVALFSEDKLNDSKNQNNEAVFISEANGGYIAEQARILQATILDAQGETKNAISTIESLSPSKMTAGILELLGDLYFKSGDKKAAQDAWKKSINKGGDKSRIGLKIDSI